MSEHKTILEAFGMTAPELAEKVGDLRYDELNKLFKALEQKFEKDALEDRARGRPKLAEMLLTVSTRMQSAEIHTRIIWMLCKNYMN